MQDDPVELLLNAHPLIQFSAYTEMQCQTLLKHGQAILKRMDEGFDVRPDGTATIDGETFTWAYGQSWLWTLGAYEVVRTMCQAAQCFSQSAASELQKFKDKLAELRVPFAKQELRGKQNGKYRPVGAEPSVYGVSHNPADIRFNVKGQTLSARKLIAEFADVMGKITRSDVLADHRQTYAAQ